MQIPGILFGGLAVVPGKVADSDNSIFKDFSATPLPGCVETLKVMDCG